MKDSLCERRKHYRSDSRDTEALIVQALNQDRDDHEYWEPIAVIQHRLPEILPRIIELAQSDKFRERELAATIFGQNMVAEKIAIDECVQALLHLVSSESDVKVISAILFSFGHLKSNQSIEAALRFRDHPDADIRYAAVSALSGFEDHRALAALIKLSSDPDCDIRNWATFGLGSLSDTNTDAIRHALTNRLQEQDDEIRGEALVGLALRGDKRVLPALLHELELHDANTLREWCLIREASDALAEREEMGKERLPVLLKLNELSIGDQSLLLRAIANCQTS